MKRWRCSVCGYIHEGDELPGKCPNCGSPQKRFGEISDDFDLIHMQYGQKISYGEEVEVNPFFGDYSAISPYIYNLPIGKKVDLHKHPTTDELFFIIKGKIKFKIGEKEIVAAKGDLVQGKMDIPHTFENIGNEPAAFLSVKGPKPVDTVMLEEV
ncbi:MAG: cupin domain-containing protein [Deltaproteobacteria bacterium]|nr:cupin domain-containing protein [Deltaproteobacteria bacterium]